MDATQETKDDVFFRRLLTNQSEARRHVNEAMARLLSIYVPNRFTRLMDEHLDWLFDTMALELGRQPGMPHPEEAVRGGRALVLIGEAGAGKSRTLRHAFRTRPEFSGYEEGIQASSLLSVVAPSPFTMSALGNEIVRKLGYAANRDIPHSKVWPVVRSLIKEQQIRIIHIDEGQHGDELSSAGMLQEMENTLKRMMEEADWPTWLILSGGPALASFCQADPSMRRRVRVLRFHPLSLADHGEDVKQIVRLIGKECPSICCEQILTVDFVGRLLHAAFHQFGIVIEFVQDAFGECLAASHDTLCLGHFADVYTARTGEPADDLNPFLARDWASIRVEEALFEEVTNSRSNKGGRVRMKDRRNKGGL
ncbi:ATP-binding protein [Xanthobacter sp. V0B-10]|uniref:ATP-binding protein n=1 Tax=Xanthobacter albus TaxID=3119929 RepID=UPI0037267A6A